MNTVHINLYKIIWQSVAIQAIFLIGFLLLNSYIHFKNTTEKVQHDIQRELTKQSDFFAGELYLGQDKALEMRLKGIESSLVSLYPDLKLCLKLVPIQENLSKVTSVCSDTISEFSQPDNIIPIQIGGILLAEVQYIIFLPFKAGQALPLNLLLAIIFSCILVSIVQFFLIQKLKRRVIEPLFETIKRNATSLAIAETASQVAHDIRSPLTALDIAAKSIINLPEAQRVLIRNAVCRIHDIANNLLTTYTKKVDADQKDAMAAPELIADMLLSVLSEKRAQYQDRAIEFVTEFGEDVYSLFSQVPSGAFKSVLSNLINNAVESIRLSGAVTLRLHKKKDALLLEILDTGCGMSSSLLSKVVVGGMSIGKKGGAGLGLSNAIKLVEEWGGKFSIRSVVNEGTVIDIILEQAPPPAWFSEQLLIPEGSTIVVLDDDTSIHDVWKKRFDLMALSARGIRVLNFYNPEELTQWRQQTRLKQVFFLIDYEFIGHSSNGLDVIEQLGIAEQAHLVTSRYENKAIQQRCEQLGVSMIPKSFAVYIPIKIFPHYA